MIHNPNNLEILLHFYCSGEAHPRRDAPAVQEGIRYLCDNEMLDRSDFPNVTEKGRAFIKHLMQVPFPVATWVIPETNDGHG